MYFENPNCQTSLFSHSEQAKHTQIKRKVYILAPIFCTLQPCLYLCSAKREAKAQKTCYKKWFSENGCYVKNLIFIVVKDKEKP